jgi:hypothetical protein
LRNFLSLHRPKIDFKFYNSSPNPLCAFPGIGPGLDVKVVDELGKIIYELYEIGTTPVRGEGANRSVV